VVESVDVEALTADDLLELLRATGRLIAWVAAVQVRAVAIAGRAADYLSGEVPGQGIVPREVIARMIATERAKLRLMVTRSRPSDSSPRTDACDQQPALQSKVASPWF
jgi:hypothetical protein